MRPKGRLGARVGIGEHSCMPGVPDTFIELALEYRNQGIPTNFSFLYDEWKRRYVPPHLDPRSDQFVVPRRPHTVYRSDYPEDYPGIGRIFLFGFVTFVLLACQCFRWWDGARDCTSLRANLFFIALVYVTLYALCERTGIYHIFAIDFVLCQSFCHDRVRVRRNGRRRGSVGG